MPRSKTYHRQTLVLAAMQQFWVKGYAATSINDLVAATGVSRHGLYADFQDKRGLFLACLQTYRDTIVTPAFAPVESATAGITEIHGYFTAQIIAAERAGLPGPGCLLANTMVESGPHDPEFQHLVRAHLERLNDGFANALSNKWGEYGPLKKTDIIANAQLLTIAAQGLWSVSRTVNDAAPLHRFVKQLLSRV